jgi:hypothetical protein
MSLSHWIRTKIVWGFQQQKVREKIEARTTKVINETSFYPHHWMNDFLYHL